MTLEDAGLHPVLGSLLKKQIVRQYTYAYGAVCPFNGDSCFLVLPKMNQNRMILMLEEMTSRNQGHYLLVVCDRASAHKIDQDSLPNNVKPPYLRPYSPQLNPQENMRDDMREKFLYKIYNIYNTAFNSMDAAEDQPVTACNYYENNPAIVRSIAGWNRIVSC